MGSAPQTSKPDAKVVITYSNGGLTWKPEIAEIPLEGVLEWEVRNLPESREVEINFPVKNGQKGPFPRTPGNGQNPRRGTYYLRKSGAIATSPADQKHYWKYDLVLRNSATSEEGRWEDEHAYDPGVIIKDGGN